MHTVTLDLSKLRLHELAAVITAADDESREKLRPVWRQRLEESKLKPLTLRGHQPERIRSVVACLE